MSDKSDVGTIARILATDIKEARAKLDDLVTLYFDRGYNSGGSDPIVDGDLTAVGITAVQLGDMINFGQQLATWLDNADPLNADWDSTLNKVRNVSHL